jgi:bacterioferritin-associated ferredoxin
MRITAMADDGQTTPRGMRRIAGAAIETLLIVSRNSASLRVERCCMLVCICNAIRENEVRDAVRKGANCPYSAYQTLGHKPKCGQCLPYARSIIEEETVAA